MTAPERTRLGRDVHAGGFLDADDFHHPVVFFINGIGDHLLALPAVRALADLFDGRLRMVCAPGMYELFFADLRITKMFPCVINPADRTFDAAELAKAIGPCDLFVSLMPWHSASITELIELLAPPHSIGFFPQFVHTRPRDYSKHAMDLAFDVPKYFDASLRVEAHLSPPVLPAEAWDSARRIGARIPASMRILAVHMDTSTEKMWPIERFTHVLGKFLENHPEFFVLVVGALEYSFDHAPMSDRIVTASGLPLSVTFCLVASADVFLGVDSCMLHAADLFRVPGVGLFGPTCCNEFGFRVARHRHVSANQNLDEVDTACVLEMLESLLEGEPERLGIR
jgi:ADP-heptose:LPS heptosyltransferase